MLYFEDDYLEKLLSNIYLYNIEEYKDILKKNILLYISTKYKIDKVNTLVNNIFNKNNIKDNNIKEKIKEINIFNEEHISAINNYNLDLENIKENIKEINNLNLELENKNDESTLIKYLFSNEHLTKNIAEKIIEIFRYELCDTDEIWRIPYLKNNNFKGEIIKLLEEGTGLKDRENKTNLMYYLKYNVYHDINIIKELESEIGLKDWENRTALMYYIENNKNPSKDIIILLKKENNLRDSDGKTPLLQYLENNKNYDKEIVDALNK